MTRVIIHDNTRPQALYRVSREFKQILGEIVCYVILNKKWRIKNSFLGLSLGDIGYLSCQFLFFCLFVILDFLGVAHSNFPHLVGISQPDLFENRLISFGVTAKTIKLHIWQHCEWTDIFLLEEFRNLIFEPRWWIWSQFIQEALIEMFMVSFY